jgi:hypothetical protein
VLCIANLPEAVMGSMRSMRRPREDAASDLELAKLRLKDLLQEGN